MYVSRKRGNRVKLYAVLLRKKESLDGADRLSDKAINKLQNYFGIAIRKNNSSVISMKKAIGAVLFHCCEATDPEACHMFCDKNEGHGVNIMKLNLKVRYTRRNQVLDFSSDELLSRCLHGKNTKQ